MTDKAIERCEQCQGPWSKLSDYRPDPEAPDALFGKSKLCKDCHGKGKALVVRLLACGTRLGLEALGGLVGRLEQGLAFAGSMPRAVAHVAAARAAEQAAELPDPVSIKGTAAADAYAKAREAFAGCEHRNVDKGDECNPDRCRDCFAALWPDAGNRGNAFAAQRALAEQAKVVTADERIARIESRLAELGGQHEGLRGVVSALRQAAEANAGETRRIEAEVADYQRTQSACYNETLRQVDSVGVRLSEYAAEVVKPRLDAQSERLEVLEATSATLTWVDNLTTAKVDRLSAGVTARLDKLETSDEVIEGLIHSNLDLRAKPIEERLVDLERDVSRWVRVEGIVDNDLLDVSGRLTAAIESNAQLGLLGAQTVDRIVAIETAVAGIANRNRVDWDALWLAHQDVIARVDNVATVTKAIESVVQSPDDLATKAWCEAEEAARQHNERTMQARIGKLEAALAQVGGEIAGVRHDVGVVQRAVGGDWAAEMVALRAGGGERDVVDRILWRVCQVHDGSDLWKHTRKDPDAFRRAVREELDATAPSKPLRPDTARIGYVTGENRCPLAELGTGWQCSRPRNHHGRCRAAGSMDLDTAIGDDLDTLAEHYGLHRSDSHGREADAELRERIVTRRLQLVGG